MGKPRVLLLHCKKYTVTNLKKEDAFHLIVASRSEHAKERIKGLADEVYVVHYDDVEGIMALAAKLHAEAPLSAIVGMKDESSAIACRAARGLGVPGLEEEAVSTASAKFRLRELLNRQGISSTRFQLVEEPRDDFSGLVAHIGFPMICKPCDGFGSVLISKCNDENELREYVGGYPFKSALLVEEFFEGPEYSVECFTKDSTHHLIAITEKLTTGAPHFVELGHIIPALLSDSDRAEIGKLVTDTLDLLKLQVGPTHTEVKLTSAGPRIIESHVRPGGDGIEQLVFETHGFALTFETLKALTGLPMKMPSSQPRVHATAQFFAYPPGAIKALQGVEAASRKRGVVAFDFAYKVGDRLDPVRSSLTRQGYFGCMAQSREGLERLIGEVRNAIKIQVEER